MYILEVSSRQQDLCDVQPPPVCPRDRNRGNTEVKSTRVTGTVYISQSLLDLSGMDSDGIPILADVQKHKTADSGCLRGSCKALRGLCGCCGALRPRYKRLVDNIFPEDPETNMEKLTFYALSAPEKLDRIGAYLSERLSRDFVKFANIEEDTPSYHRSYDFFVSRFSEMCHSSYEDPDGVVRKTVNDELQANIWEPQHMDKIVPSLLFNLQDPTDRELLGRAAYGNIKNAVKPVLMHLDNHSLWEGKSFAVRCFKIIMYSIQSYAAVRAGIVEVLSEAAVIEASGSVGPTVLEVFNTLLKQLRLSVDYELTGCCDPYSNNKTTTDQERQLQEAVIKTIGSFANTLPIYQRAEVMLFIMGKIPVPGMYPALGSPIAGFEGMTERYESSNMLTALPSSFLEPLLSFTLMEDPEIRLLHGQRLYRHIFLACSEENSGRSHYQALYILLALLSVELANEEVVVDLIRLALALQDLALANDERLSLYNRCAVHALSAAYLSLISQLTTVPAFCQHIQEVIELRQKESLERVEGEVFFQQFKIAEVLGRSGYNIDILNTPFTPQITVDSVNGEEQEREKRRLVTPTRSVPVYEMKFPDLCVY
ncbi:unnamed protein product [Coregonus sp. 'balchen']|nr:unnamed protein product [Coregonus sp. 'balchen']